MSLEFSLNEEIYYKYKMDYFLEGMEKEMKFLIKICFIKCVLFKLIVFEKKMINKIFGIYC